MIMIHMLTIYRRQIVTTHILSIRVVTICLRYIVYAFDDYDPYANDIPKADSYYPYGQDMANDGYGRGYGPHAGGNYAQFGKFGYGGDGGFNGVNYGGYNGA